MTEAEARAAGRVRTWNYWNGESYTWLGVDYHTPMTAAYCGACGPAKIPGFDNDARDGTGHHSTGFKCGPWRVGRPCDGCGKDI